MRVWLKRYLQKRNSRLSDSSVNEMNLWEHLAGFFYGEQQEEAKSVFFDLADEQACDNKKYNAFQRLRKLAAEIFCDQFIEEGVKNGDGSWDVTLLIKSWHINQPVFQMRLTAVKYLCC